MTVNITTIVQVATPGEIRGRVFGLLGSLSASLAPIAMGLSGIVADLVNQNIPLIYVSCGVIMTVLSLAVTASRHFRQFLAQGCGGQSQSVVEVSTGAKLESYAGIEQD